MSSKESLFLLLATIFALELPLVNGATLEKRPYQVLDDSSGISPPQLCGGDSPPDVNCPPVAPEGPTPAAAVSLKIAAATTTCTLWGTCNLFYPVSNALVDQTQCRPNISQYVNVYYWPESSQNTACHSANPHITPSSPPDIPNVYDSNSSYARFANVLTLCSQSPSVYMIFPSIYASDGCNRIGSAFTNLTTSLPFGVLSTIGLDKTTYSFNFGDLPCPPADVGWDPSKGSYAPQLAPPSFLTSLDTAFATCIPALTQGIDPPTTLTTATAGSGVESVGCGKSCKRAKRALEHPHLVPWAPQKTAEPTS